MKLLIVEDEIKLAHAMQRALELQKYVVDVAYDGESGFDRAQTKKYDLIILDLMLPKLNGIEVCTELRNENNTTPIIMLTAKGQVSDKTKGLDSGADDYMVKPFSFEELFSRIKALVRRTAKETAALLQVGKLSLDPVTYKVTHGSKSIALSAKEFAILEYLLKNKNKVISKSQIVAHVWDYDADILPSTVEVHMKNLRDKIDRPFGTTHIHTVRGFGYEMRDKE